MKTIGLIGGMSWESTVPYYQIINRGVRAKLGGLHSAQIAMISVDFHEVELCQQSGDWLAAGQLLARAAQQLEAAGADFLLICANTMHKVAPAVAAAVDIPLLHIADATAIRIKDTGYQQVGLLGTRFVMEQAFYRERLRERHGIQVLTPTAEDRCLVHDIIYDELCLGDIRQTSRDTYLAVIDRLADQGAEAVILGCTEIGLLIKPGDTALPLLDTTEIHATAAIDYALCP